MVHVTQSLLIAARPSLVWACLMEETLLPSWVEGLVLAERMDVVSDDGYPRIDFSIDVDRKRLRGTTLVTASRDERLYALETRVGSSWLLFDTIRLADERGGTRLDVASELHNLDENPVVEMLFDRPTGLLGGPREHPLERAYARSFASFKKLVESRAIRPYR